MVELTVKQASELLGVTESTIKKAVAANRLEAHRVPGVGRGGQQLRISLDSLPQAAQDKYHGIERERQNDAYSRLTADQRKQVDFKRATIARYMDFKKAWPHGNPLEAFLKQHNADHPDKPITRRQLTDWCTKYKRDGISGLKDRRGGALKGVNSIPEDVWNTFVRLWSKTSQPSASSCYKIVQHAFPDRKIPDLSTFSRKLKALPYPYVVYWREGEKAWEDKCSQHNIIDYSGLRSNQQWVADHHVFDILVVDDTGRVFRPWVCAWLDRKSRHIVGYSVTERDPNSDLILDSFAKACYACGIPDSVLLDNGKDFKVYDLFCNDFPMSVSREMGIEVHRALPFNAKAKPLERWFGTVEGYCKHLPAYIGNSPARRPEAMKGTNNQLRDKAMPIGEFRVFFDNLVNAYNSTPHTGDGMNGRTPLDVYANSFTMSRRIVKDDDVLHMFLMRTSKLLKVGRNGVKVPQIGHYYEDEILYSMQREKVYVRWNTDDVRKVYIFDKNDDFVCIAKCKELCKLDIAVDMTIIRETARKKAAQKRMIKEMNPVAIEPTIAQTIEARAANRENGFENVITLPIVNSTKHKQSLKIKKEEQRQALKEQSSSTITSLGVSAEEIDNRLYQLFKTKGEY